MALPTHVVPAALRFVAAQKEDEKILSQIAGPITLNDPLI
jgi:hypothetical protein